MAIPLGVALGLGLFTFGYAEGSSYLGNAPETCANCHIMNEQYDGWVKGSHKAVATCNDCHTPHDFVGKYATKALNGFNHSKAFTLQDFHEPIQINARNAAILQQSCLHCHGDFVRDTRRGQHHGGGRAALRALPQRRRARPGALGRPWPTDPRDDSGCPFLATVLVTAAISAGIAALLLNVAERKREARDPYLKLVNVGEGTTDSKPWGVNWPRQFDSYLRTVDATRTRYGGSDGSPTALAAREGSVARAHVRRLCLRDRFPRAPRPRAHARGPGADPARHRAAAAGRVSALSRVGDPDVPPPRWRRRDGGLRRARQALVLGRARRSREDGLRESRLRWAARSVSRRCPARIPSAASTATIPRRWSCASHGLVSSPASRSWRRATRPCRTSRAWSAGDDGDRKTPYDAERRRVAAGDALVRLRAVPRRVLLRPEDDAVLSLGQGAARRADRSVLRRVPLRRRPPLLRLAARRDRRRGAEGAAPRVRDLEPGHPRARRRRVRRLPHALSARGRDEGERPLGAQSAAEHRARLPDLSPRARGRAPGARRRRSRTAPTR